MTSYQRGNITQKLCVHVQGWETTIKDVNAKKEQNMKNGGEKSGCCDLSPKIQLKGAVCACVYLGCPVPQTVHGHSCSVVRVSHVDDWLPDGLDHLLLTLQKTQQSGLSPPFLGSGTSQMSPHYLPPSVCQEQTWKSPKRLCGRESAWSLALCNKITQTPFYKTTQ